MIIHNAHLVGPWMIHQQSKFIFYIIFFDDWWNFLCPIHPMKVWNTRHQNRIPYKKVWERIRFSSFLNIRKIMISFKLQQKTLQEHVTVNGLFALPSPAPLPYNEIAWVCWENLCHSFKTHWSNRPSSDTPLIKKKNHLIISTYWRKKGWLEESLNVLVGRYMQLGRNKVHAFSGAGYL